MGLRVLGGAVVSLYSGLVAAEVRQPVAIRVARPYSTEDEFLEHELDTLTRTSVTLIGAQSRPQGVILRFEVTLAHGAPLMRGEGRVIAFKPGTAPQPGQQFEHLPGLTLRFTRLDKKTKALVDRAALIREERAHAALRASLESELPPPPQPEPSRPVTDAADAADAADATGEEEEAEAQVAAEVAHDATHAEQAGPASSGSATETESTEPDAAPAEASQPEQGQATVPLGPLPRDRDSLLLRLRERARALAPETVAAILHSHSDPHTSTQE